MVGISSPNSVRNGDTADGMNRGLVKIHLTQKSIVELVSCPPRCHCGLSGSWISLQRATYSVLGDPTLHVETVLRGNGEWWVKRGVAVVNLVTATENRALISFLNSTLLLWSSIFSNVSKFVLPQNVNMSLSLSLSLCNDVSACTTHT